MDQTRQTKRDRITEAIGMAARAQIAEHGGGGLSMRAVAREVGLVSSAIYRYFPTREALLTAMIIESYANLATALRQVRANGPDRRWRALGRALRRWGTEAPHEYQLIYGTPIPGYVAPPETVAAATSVAEPFLRVGALRPVPGFDARPLTRQFEGFDELIPGIDPSGAAAVIAELASLAGMISLEIAGHFVGTADPADRLYTAVLDRQVQTLGLG